MEDHSPLWMTTKESKINEAVLSLEYIDNPEELAEVATIAPFRIVREIAVDLLNDDALLANIAMNNSDGYVRVCALKKAFQANSLEHQQVENIVGNILSEATASDLEEILKEVVAFLPQQMLTKFDIRIEESDSIVMGHELYQHQRIYYNGKLITWRNV